MEISRENINILNKTEKPHFLANINRIHHQWFKLITINSNNIKNKEYMYISTRLLTNDCVERLSGVQ